jgi:hypothetical protein
MGTRKGLGCKLKEFVSGNILYCTISPFESSVGHQVPRYVSEGWVR